MTVEQEHIWQMAWQRAFGLTMLHMLIPVVGCYFGILVAFYRHRDWSVVALCAFCLIVCPALPVGILLALVFGWMRARRWQMQAFMTVWTCLVVLLVLDVVVAVVLRDLDGTTLRRLFGSDR